MPGGSWICPLDSNQKKLIVTAKRRPARVTSVYATAAAIPNITMKGSGKKATFGDLQASQWSAFNVILPLTMLAPRHADV